MLLLITCVVLSPSRTREDNPFLSALASSSSSSGAHKNTSNYNPFLSPIKKKTSVSTHDTVEEDNSSPDLKSHDPRLTAEPLPDIGNQSLHLKGVPDEVNDEAYLLSHFSKYGPVDSVQCDPTKKCANVHFRARVCGLFLFQ